MARFTTIIKKTIVLPLVASGMCYATGGAYAQSTNVSVVVNRTDLTYAEGDSSAEYNVILSAPALQDTWVTLQGQYLIDNTSSDDTLTLTVTNNILIPDGLTSSVPYTMVLKDGTFKTSTGIKIIPTITNPDSQAQYPDSYYAIVRIQNVAPGIDTVPTCQPTTSAMPPYNAIELGKPFVFRSRATDIIADVNGTPPISVQFQFEDGTIKNAVGIQGMVTNTFTSLGAQSVTMVATDKDGGQQTVSFPIMVIPSLPPPAVTVVDYPVVIAENDSATKQLTVMLSQTPFSAGITDPVDVYLIVTPANSALNGAVTIPILVTFYGSQATKTVSFNVQDGTLLSAGSGFTVTPRIVAGQPGSTVYTQFQPGRVLVHNVAPIFQQPVDGSTKLFVTFGQPSTFNWSIDDVAADLPGMMLLWDWGDGTTSTTTGGSGTTTHTYNAALSQASVTVRATDKDSDFALTSFSVVEAYDVPKYLAVGANVASFGVTNAVQVASANSGDGGTSVKLGGIGLLADGDMAGIELHVTGPGVLSFDWKVSSEDFWDWLSFYEAGASLTNRISGVTEWERQSVTVLGAPEAIHTFRWEYEKDAYGDYVGEDCGWVDAITWSPFYTLAVAKGTGDGSYTNGAVVLITAEDAPSLYEFDRWTGDTNTVANIFSASTTLQMPNTNTFVTATYKPSLYTLNVINGSGSGVYAYQSSIEMRANEVSGKRFHRWTGDVDAVADVNSATTTVIISDMTLNLIATYYVLLTVNSGSGSGWYPEGGVATVTADPDPLMYKEFGGWTGSAADYTSDRYSRSTTVTVPTFASELEATYRDSVARAVGCWGRGFTTDGTDVGISIDGAAGSPSGTPAVKMGGAGVIPNNAFTAFETMVSGSGTVSFWWRVSSQLNADYLRFKIDGVETNSISGTKNTWTQVTRRVEGDGEHTMRWEYVKDGSAASSSDAGWVDDIVWRGDIEMPALAPVIVLAAITNQNMAIQFTGERGITYLIQTNGTLNPSGWFDYQAIQPTWVNESNGVHRFEIMPPASAPDKLFYRVATPTPSGMVAIPAGTNSGTDPDFGAY